MANIYSVTSRMKYGKYLQWGFKLDICSLLNHFVSRSHQCICIVIYVCIQRLYFHWYFKHEGDRVYDTCPTDRLVNRVNTLAHPSAMLSTNISLQTIYLKRQMSTPSPVLKWISVQTWRCISDVFYTGSPYKYQDCLIWFQYSCLVCLHSLRDVLDDQLWARSASNGWSSNWSWFWHACRPNSSIFPGIFFFFTFFSDHFPLHFLCNAVDKTAQDFQEKH